MTRTAVPVVEDARRVRPTPVVSRTVEWVVLAVFVLGFLVAGLAVIIQGGTLGHDEAVYSLKALSYAGTETGPFYWRDFRAPGLPLTLAAFSALGRRAGVFRTVVLVFGAAGIVATWALGRLLAGPRAALAAAGVLAIMPGWLTASTQVWPDVPGAVLGLVAIVAVLRYLDQPRNTVAAVAVVAGVAATYFRFGAPLAVGVPCLVLCIVRWRSVLPRMRETLAVGAAMVGGILLVLLWPPMTGSTEPPLVAVRELTARADTTFFIQAATDLVGSLPMSLGVVAGISIVAGWGWGLYRLAVGRPAPGVITAMAMAITAALVLFASLPHGEPRYLAPVLPLLAITAGPLLGEVSGRGGALLAGIAIVWCVGLLFVDDYAVSNMRLLSDRHGALQQVAEELRADRRRPCAVVSTFMPQVEWYSRCPSSEPSSWEDPATARVAARASTGELYVIAVEGGKRQPPDDELWELARGWGGELVAESTRGTRDAWLWHVQGGSEAPDGP